MSVYRFISAEKARTPVSVCCELLGVSRSGFYDWLRRAPSDRALSDAWLTEKIKAIHQANRGVYGRGASTLSSAHQLLHTLSARTPCANRSVSHASLSARSRRLWGAADPR